MADILNILVVEDEKPIRDDLASFPWDECDAFLIGEASHGQEALEYFEDLVPDIVVTDISMPVMNGLELMNHVNRRFPETAFIIMTCHADFDFARQALKLGAVDYIMKAGMKEEDLKAAVLKARQQIRSVRGFRQSIWRENLWRRTAEAQSFALGRGHLSDFMEFPSRLESIQFISIRRDAIFVNRLCQEYLEQTQESGWFSQGTNCLARFCPTEMQIPLEQRMSALVAAADHKLPYLGGEIRFFGSMSDPIDNEVDAQRAIRQLDLWRDVVFYEDDDLIFEGSPEELPELHDLQRDKLESMNRSAERSLSSLLAFIRTDLYSFASQLRVKPDHLKSVVLSWRERWTRRYLPGGPDERFWIEITGVSSLRELTDLLARELDSGTAGENIQEGDLRPELRQARAIVREEYASPLTLPDVAKRVGLSVSYLSRVLKSETGRSFKEYLTETRVSRAIELLQTTGVKVYEVAEAVGFPSYRYFSSVFRTMTGQRPKDYRSGQINAV